MLNTAFNRDFKAKVADFQRDVQLTNSELRTIVKYLEWNQDKIPQTRHELMELASLFRKRQIHAPPLTNRSVTPISSHPQFSPPVTPTPSVSLPNLDHIITFRQSPDVPDYYQASYSSPPKPSYQPPPQATAIGRVINPNEDTSNYVPATAIASGPAPLPTTQQPVLAASTHSNIPQSVLDSPTSSIQDIGGTEFTVKTLNGDPGEVRTQLREWMQEAEKAQEAYNQELFEQNEHLYIMRDKDPMDDDELYCDDGVLVPPADMPHLPRFSMDSDGKVFPIHSAESRENTPDYLKRIEKSSSITSIINRQMDAMSLARNPNNIVKISYANGEIQSIAIVDTAKNELKYLASNPTTMPSPHTSKAPVRGGGTSIIKDLAENHITAQKPLILDAVPEAVGFYNKVGAVVQRDRTPSEADLVPMQITAQKVDDMRRAHIGLFKG